MLSSLPCFYAFYWSAIPTSCYISNVCFFLFLFMAICSSRFMLELKFAIYHRAATLSSQTLASEDTNYPNSPTSGVNLTSKATTSSITTPSHHKTKVRKWTQLSLTCTCLNVSALVQLWNTFLNYVCRTSYRHLAPGKGYLKAQWLGLSRYYPIHCMHRIFPLCVIHHFFCTCRLWQVRTLATQTH